MPDFQLGQTPSLAGTVLNGVVVWSLKHALTDRLSAVLAELKSELSLGAAEFQVVLPSGKLLAGVLASEPDAVLGTCLEGAP